MSWLKNQFVPTAAAQLLQRLAVEVAGHNCVVAVTARRGFGKSFLARQVMALAGSLGIKNRIAYVEFWGEEENTNAVLRRIAVGVGWNHEDVRLMGTSQLFDCIVEFIHRNKVDLMFIDNAHVLSTEALALIGQMTSTFPRRRGLARLPNELVLAIEEEMGTKCDIGVILLGQDLAADQVEALAESCDWWGIKKLPPLSLEEMVEILNHWDDRFRIIAERARQNPQSDEFTILRALYQATEGSFGKFERILRRFEFAPDAPILLIGIATALEAYRKSQYIPWKDGPRKTIKI